jgi:MFS family permease
MDRYFPLILIVSLVSFVDFLDATMVFMIGPDISDYFDVGISDASWLVMGYDLILCALIIPMAKVAKAGYTRAMLVSGLVLFTFGTVMCSFSVSYWMLIAFRVVQGAGAVLAVSTLPVIIVSLFPDEMQGRVTGAMLTGAGAGMVLAPVIGSWLVENVGWQYAFLVAVPACIAALALSLRFIPLASEKAGVHMDVVGAALTITLIGTTLMFFEDVIDGGLIVILYAAVAMVSAVLLAVHIRRGEDRGLITHSIVSNRDFRVLAVSMLTAVMLVEGMMFLIPFVLLGEFKMEMFEAGLFFAVVSVSVVLLSIPVGKICESRGCRAIIVLGCIIAIVFSIAFVAIDATWPILLLVVVLLAVGASYAIFETAHYVRLIRQVPGPLKDEAATFGTMISFLGASLGVAVFDIAVDLTLNDIPIEAVHTAALMAAVMAAAGAITTLMIREKPADQRAVAEKDNGFVRAGPPARDDHAFFAGAFLAGAFFAVLAAGLAVDFLVPALGPLLALAGASVSLRKQRNQS